MRRLIVLMALAFALCGFAPAQLVINEVDADQAGTDANEFVEIYDGGVGNSPLTGLVLVFFNGNGDVSYNAVDLTGVTNAQGYYLLGSVNVAGTDQTLGDVMNQTNLIQNGADGIGLYVGSAAAWPNGTPATNVGLVDAVCYDTNDPPATSLVAILTPGQPQINEGSGAGTSTADSIARCPDGGAQLVTTTYLAITPTPGQPNSLACPTGPAFLISITQPVACGNITIGVSGALANAELFNLIALECSNPAGSGPLFGLSVSAAAGPILSQLALPPGTDPFHVFADGSGAYNLLIPLSGTCLGVPLNLEAVSIEINSGIVTNISPTTGCVSISL